MLGEHSLLLIGLGPYGRQVAEQARKRLTAENDFMPILICAIDDRTRPNDANLEFRVNVNLSDRPSFTRGDVFAAFRDPTTVARFSAQLEQACQMLIRYPNKNAEQNRRVWIVCRADEPLSAILGDVVCAANQWLPGAQVSIMLTLPAEGRDPRTLAAAQACLVELDHLLTKRQWTATHYAVLRSVYMLQDRRVLAEDEAVVAEQVVRLMLLEYCMPILLSGTAWNTAFVTRFYQSGGMSDVASHNTVPASQKEHELKMERKQGLRTQLVTQSDAHVRHGIVREWTWRWLVGSQQFWDGFTLWPSGRYDYGLDWLMGKRSAYLVGQGSIPDIREVMVPFVDAYNRVRFAVQLHAPVIEELLQIRQVGTGGTGVARPHFRSVAVPDISPQMPIAAPAASVTKTQVPSVAPRQTAEEEREAALAVAYCVLFSLTEWHPGQPDYLINAPVSRRKAIEQGEKAFAMLKEQNRLHELGALINHADMAWKSWKAVNEGFARIRDEVESAVPEEERPLFRRLCESMALAIDTEAAREFAIKGGLAGYSVRMDGGTDQ